MLLDIYEFDMEEYHYEPLADRIEVMVDMWSYILDTLFADIEVSDQYDSLSTPLLFWS